MPLTVVCSACRAALPGVPDTLAGKTIKCPHCTQPVAVPTAASVVPPELPPKLQVIVPEAVLPPAPTRRKPAEDDDRPSKRKTARWDDDDDDRPRRKTGRRKAESKKLNLPLLIGVGAGVLLLAVGAVITGIVLLKPSQTAKATDAAKPTTPLKSEKPKTVDGPPQNPVTRRESLSAEAIATLKQGTVYIEVDDGDGGGGSGSGWFGGEAGLIITNAHVLGMMTPDAKEPANISVFTNSGVKGKQKLYDGPRVKVVAVDRDMDLAVIQLAGETDLPPPLPVRPARQLVELDKLVCFGFPGGRRLADRNRSAEPPVVTVTSSAVSALRNDDGGVLYSVQIQGVGVVHGNSGGPVTDTDGNVIGVVVRVDLDQQQRLTGIAYAVPSEHVTGLLAGRAMEATVGQGYIKGNRVIYPISVKCADAMARLTSVGVGVWEGDKSSGVRGGGDAHKAEKGDTGYREVALTYNKSKRVATGEIDFPKDTAGRTLWAQPYYAGGTAKRYLEGKPLPEDSVPVEQVVADMTAPKFPVGGAFKLTVDHFVMVKQRVEKDGEELGVFERGVVQVLKFQESVQRPKAENQHAILVETLEPNGMKVGLKFGEAETDAAVAELRVAREALALWQGSTPVSRDGKAAGGNSGAQTYARGVGPAEMQLANRLGGQLSTAPPESLLRLPGKRVNAGDTWEDSNLHRIRWHPDMLLAEDGKRKAVVGEVSEDMTYTYLGQRTRAGRTEWVVRMEGVLRPLDGTDRTAICGVLEGEATLDAATGMVLSATVRRGFVLEAEVRGAKVKVGGKEVTMVTREK